MKAVAAGLALLVLLGCRNEPATAPDSARDLCSETSDPAVIGRRQPYIKGWTIPERAATGIPVLFRAGVSDTCGLVQSRSWVFGRDTVAADKAGSVLYTFPAIVDDSFPVAFLIHDAQGAVKEQRGALSVGSWVYRSEYLYGYKVRFLAESQGRYVYLATEQAYPETFPALLFLSTTGALAQQVRVPKSGFDVSAVLVNGDGTFIAGGGLVTGQRYTGTTYSTPLVALLNLDGSVAREVPIAVTSGSYSWVAAIQRTTGGFLLAINQERPYVSGTAVGSNNCPTVTHYLAFDLDWKETAQRKDTSFACGMIGRSVPDGAGGMAVLGYQRSETNSINKVFLLAVGADLSIKMLDSSRSESWSDLVKTETGYLVLGGPAPFVADAPPKAFLRTVPAAGGPGVQTFLEGTEWQPGRLIRRGETLFAAGFAARNGYGEADDYFVLRMDPAGKVERKYVNTIGDGPAGCDLALAGNGSLLASAVLYRSQSIVNSLVVMNLDGQGRGVLK